MFIVILFLSGKTLASIGNKTYLSHQEDHNFS